MELQKQKKMILGSIVNDAREKCSLSVKLTGGINSTGRIKVSRKEMIDKMMDIWIAAEMSSAERILRCIELDGEASRLDIIADIHIHLQEVTKLLVSRGVMLNSANINDLVPGGKYSTPGAVI